MQRKILLSIVLLCLIGISVFLVVFLKRVNVAENNATKAIPADAAMVVEIQSIHSAAEMLNSPNNLLNALSELAILKKGTDFIRKIDSSASTDEKYNVFNESELFFVVKKIGQNKLDFLYVIPLQNVPKGDFVKEFFESTFDLKNPSSYGYKDANINSYVDEQSDRRNLSYAIYNNTLMVSESKVSVESALKGFWDDNSLENDSDFQEIRPKALNVPVRVFFHYNRMASVMQLYASDEYVKRINDFPKIASWTELDVNIAETSLRFNGYITTDSANSSSEYMYLFRGQQAVKGEASSVIPASTVCFVALCISDKDLYKTNYENYLTRNNFHTSYNNRMKSLKEDFASNDDISKLFYSWLDKELVYVQMPTYTGLEYENTFCLMKLESRKTAESEFQSLLAHSEDRNSLFTEHFVGENQYKIYKMPVGNVPQSIWGSLFSHTIAKYVFFVDSYMVFGNSENSCLAFLSEYEKNNTLSSDSNYGRFDDNLKNTYSLFAYSSIPQCLPMFKTFFDEKTASVFDEYSSDFKNLDAFSYQLIADNDKKLYNDIYVSLLANKQDKPKIEWRLALDTICASQPKMFRSHRGEFLTLVQDAKNQLYLIDNDKHRIEWKKQLDGKIMGEINLVDVYASGKIQYLFNTENTIYLLDKNGNKVENFPISLDFPATAPVAVFDYDKVKKYRLAIPCENNSIKLFALNSGKWNEISDWNVTTESKVTTQMRHFSDAGKDYIVFADQYHVYIVNRKGEPRVVVEELIEKAPNANIEFEPGAESSLSRFVTTDVDGVVKEIYLDGSVKSTDNLGKRGAQHYFMKKDLDNDGNGELIFVDENKIDVYQLDFKKMFSYSASSTLANVFVYQLKNGDCKICASGKLDRKMYVVNGDGALCKGFPLDGATPFYCSDESMEKGFGAIVGNEQNLLYYYAVK